MAGQKTYTNLSDAKAYLGISDTNSTSDRFLTLAIQNVQKFVDTYTKRTFGWGDVGDNPEVDYSNSDNIGVISTNLVGSSLTINTMGPATWAVGQNVSLFGFLTSAYNGVWAVTAVNSPVQLVVNISVSKGTLSPTNLAVVAGSGYIGNYVSNYRYVNSEQHDGLVGKTIFLRNMDIRSIDSLYIGLRNVAQPVLLDHTQYVWRDDGRIILGGAYFNSYDSSIYSSANDNAFYGTVAAGYQTITVSYWHGFVGVPSDISLAVLDIIASTNTLRKSNGLSEERVGDYWARYDTDIRKALATQPDTMNILNVYRRRRV